MSDGIEFNPDGTVAVTFNDKTYYLAQGVSGRFKYYTRRLNVLTKTRERERRQLLAAITEVQQRYSDEDTPEAQAEIERLNEETQEFRLSFDALAEITAEMFEELGDPLPQDQDEWPVWLADEKIPGQILGHWRDVPKASGPTDQT
jgi:hypothetical protein